MKQTARYENSTLPRNFATQECSAPPMSPPAVSGPDFDWRIETPELRRCLMVKKINGQNIYYLPHQGSCYLENGAKIATQNPCLDYIEKYLEKYNKLNRFTVSEFKAAFGEHWQLDPVLRTFYRDVLGKLVYRFGYRAQMEWEQ
jgi:hypothetical protein